MTKFLKVIWFAILSLAVGLSIFFLLIFLTWGRIVSVEIIYYISIGVGLVTFFIIYFMNSKNQKEKK